MRALKQWTLLIAIVVGPWGTVFLTVHVACAVAARLHAPADLLQHLAARSAVPSSAPHPDEPSNRHEPWPLRADAPWHPAIAQGVCMAALTPTATAAAIITGMLGGSVAFLAAYAFLSNLAIVVLAPLVLPLIATGQIDTPFLETMSNVFMRVGPTMLFPLLTAWLINTPPQGQRRAAALGHSGLLPVGGDARHPYGRHL
ncbi:MAG: hypothetical protein ACLR0N_00505 [Bilophila wadsworthia]